MSDFVPKDLLPDLWEEILQRLWHFLDTEEGLQKIEERKKLESCLKEFLCVVRHDRKFFLPETAQVLKQSIRELEDFSANKAIAGFEAVSQYANNLFTKPWRKEFRILKTYSGFYQHEIESNLVNAVKLFEAMGYRRLSEYILVLDGPICPDQVTNVSRDAMAAYVECQIIKNIYSGLATAGIKCSWQDIFHYREKYVGGTSQAIKELAYAIQERRHHKEKLLNSDNSGYATIQHLSAGSVPAPPPPPPQRNQCQCCAPYHHSFMQQQQQQPCALHGNNQIQTGCALHPTKVSLMCNGSSSGGGGVSSNKMYTSYPTAATGHCRNHTQAQQSAAGTAHMSHSRSLEHYNEPPPLLPHRHSFDHQQQGCTAHHAPHYQLPRGHTQQYAHQHLYESPYDCIDASGVGLPVDDSMEDGSSVSYAAVTSSNTHPYNVSGNRYPLPYNISNELSAHYSTPTAAAVTCNGVSGNVYDTYGAPENAYATIAKPTHSCGHQQQRSPLPSARLLSALNVSSRDAQNNHRQRAFPPEQLIDFDDRALLTAHDYNAQQHMQMQTILERDSYFRQQPDQRLVNRVMNGLNPTYAEPKDILSHQQQQQQRFINSTDDAYGSHAYARPVPRSSRLKEGQNTKQTTDKYLRKTDSMQGYQFDNNRKIAMELDERCGGGGGGGGLEKLNGGMSRRKLSSQSNERDFSDLSYESGALDDYVTVGHSEHPQRSPTQAIKNQDGVGSYESWNYVFKKLDRTGYTKDLGDREDLLVQSLDLDSLNLGTTSGGVGGGSGGVVVSGNVVNSVNANQNVEKRRAVETKSFENGEKFMTLEKAPTTTTAAAVAVDKRGGDSKSTKQTRTSILKTTTTTNAAQNAITANGNKKTKSALKPTTTTTSTTTTTNANATATVDHSKSNGNTRNIKRQTSTGGGPTRSANGKKIPVATQVIVSKPNEWSCSFCTFLNPDTKNICDMCCRSKDFNLEHTVSNTTPTCV